MEKFLNDFTLFFEKIFSCCKILFDWLTSNILGEIIIFVIIVSLFFFFINLFIKLKD